MESSFEWNIVLIDDEQDIRDVVSMTLKDSGYGVITAEDGETGLLVPPADPEALSGSIRRLLADRVFARNLGEKAAKVAHSRFSVEQHIARIDGVYRRVLERRAAP